MSPLRPARARVRYLPLGLVLETTFTSPDGGHRLGVGVPHLLVRRLTSAAGSVEVDIA